MSITHTDPLANLRFFEDAFTRMLSEPRAGRPWSPAVDIFETEDTSKGYHRIERGYGQFTRSFTLPQTVDTEKVAAEYHNGVLTVKLPKKAAAKPRQVKIDVKQ